MIEPALQITAESSKMVENVLIFDLRNLQAATDAQGLPLRLPSGVVLS